MDARQYDEARGRRRRKYIVVGIVIALILAWVGYHFRNYPERRAAGQFFAALQRGDLEGAYALWMKDPSWKQHPEKYSRYSFGDFSQDWGPSGEWGIIKSHKIDCSYSYGTGVIVRVTVNHRLEPAYVLVDKDERTFHFLPTDNGIDCGNWWGWLTE